MTTRFDFQSQLGELATLRDHVLAMYETLEGGAHFESMESNVLVERTIDRFGHVFGAMILRISRGAETWAELTLTFKKIRRCSGTSPQIPERSVAKVLQNKNSCPRGSQSPS
jgi:hypothetical protein